MQHLLAYACINNRIFMLYITKDINNIIIIIREHILVKLVGPFISIIKESARYPGDLWISIAMFAEPEVILL